MAPPAATAAGRLASGVGTVAGPARHVRSRGGSVPKRSVTPPSARRRVSGGTPRTTAPAPVAVAPVAAPAVEVASKRIAAESIRSDRSFAILSRSRALIAGFALLLGGLVFLENHAVALNSAIGVNVQKISMLERENAVLRGSISSLSSDQRVVAQAKRMGFVEPPVGSSQFLGVRRGDPAEAVATMAPAQAGTAYASAGLDASNLSADQASPDINTSGVAATVDQSQFDQVGGATTTAAVPTGEATGTGG